MIALALVAALVAADADGGLAPDDAGAQPSQTGVGEQSPHPNPLPKGEEIDADAGVGAPVPEVTAPAAHCTAPPVYPESERASQRAGKVTVQVKLAKGGAVKSIDVAEGMGAPFDQLAVDAVGKCTFESPADAIVVIGIDFTPPPKKGRIEGVVVGELNQPIAGATVTAQNETTTTDKDGKFVLEVEPGEEVWILVSKPELKDAARAVRLPPGELARVQFKLIKPSGFETTVTANRFLPPPPQIDRTPQVSHFTIERADIDRTPGALEDVARVVQSFPGVASDSDLLSTFYVRGGGPDEVVYYLDDVALSNPFHLGGFASIYNPELIENANFYAGAIPAQYEPALSGALDVNYATGEATRFKAAADVSMNTAKARLDVPLPVDGMSAVISARRSYYEAYFAGLKAISIVGQNYVAPEIGDYFVRLHWKTGNHHLSATYLYSTDGFSFDIKPGEQVLVNFAGGLSVDNRLQMGILHDDIDLGGGKNLRLTGALVSDSDHTRITSTALYANAFSQVDADARADFTWSPTDVNRLQAGASYAHRTGQIEGDVADARAVAPWTTLPFVDTGLPNLQIHPVISRDLVSVYVDDVYKPVPHLALEAGARLQNDLDSNISNYSLRAAGSYELPTQTVLKLSTGLATELQQNPVLFDEKFGNPNLEPERVFNLVAGLEQPVPFGALVRLEGFGKWMDHLVANPDTRAGLDALTAAGEPAFQNKGTGYARGVDLMVLGRAKEFAYGFSYSLVFSDRTNPLATGLQTYPAPWDQRHTLAAHFSLVIAKSWMATVRGTFHTGRPYTPVVGFTRDDANQRFLPVFGDPNSARFPSTYEINFRLEKHFNAGPLAMAWYIEVLNVTNAQNVFAYIYDKGDYAAGVEPGVTAFNHLPIRPFLGIRGEY